jgi:hypothetical protein
MMQITELVLQKEIKKYLDRHPQSDMKAAITNVIKYRIPNDICQTPRWHKERLDDLIAMVKKWGMWVLTAVTASKCSWYLQRW